MYLLIINTYSVSALSFSLTLTFWWNFIKWINMLVGGDGCSMGLESGEFTGYSTILVMPWGKVVTILVWWYITLPSSQGKLWRKCLLANYSSVLCRQNISVPDNIHTWIWFLLASCRIYASASISPSDICMRHKPPNFPYNPRGRPQNKLQANMRYAP